jgi:hypothetical protein
MPDGPLAREVRNVVHHEFKQRGFRNRRSNFFCVNGDYVAFSSLQKSWYGECFYLDIGYILEKPFPPAERMTVQRCNVRARANHLATVRDERYIDRLLDTTQPLGDIDRTAELRTFLDRHVFPALSGGPTIDDLRTLLKSSFGGTILMDRYAQTVIGPLDVAATPDES